MKIQTISLSYSSSDLSWFCDINVLSYVYMCYDGGQAHTLVLCYQIPFIA